MSVLNLNNVTKSYSGDQVAVNNVNLQITEREVLALTGESGCGKTTLLRLIAGLEEPDAGSITIEDRQVASAKESLPPQRRPVGLVFQDYALFPHMTVMQNVSFGLEPVSSNQPSQRANEVIDLVNLTGLEKRYPHQLSGGQQQRVAIARALAPNPKLLLLDEPFSNLDTLLKDQVRKEILEIIHQSGTTAILVTHDVQDALSMADRVAVLKNGEIQQVDTPQNLFECPVNKYVASFFGKVNLIPVIVENSRVTCELGSFEARNTGGKSGTLCLRPHQVSLSSDVTSGISAQVLSTNFYGNYKQVELQIDDYTIWCYQSLDFECRSGQKVGVTCDFQSTHIIWD